MIVAIKQHDTAPSIQVVLLSGTSPIDLTGATVKFIMRLPGAGSPKVSAAATVTSAVGGQVTYNWVSGDTSVLGRYQAEWEITFGSGQVETVPNDGYDVIQILADLG